jgi:hypothetical protein
MKHIFSRTVIGAALFAAAHILSDPRNPTNWVEGAGMIISAYGARSAIAKNGNGQ